MSRQIVVTAPVVYLDSVFSYGILPKYSTPSVMEKNEMNRTLGHLCAQLNWVRRTSWGWWNELDDTVLQAQDLKFEPWRSEAEHATSRSRRLPTILIFTRGWGRTPESSGANHYLRAPAHRVWWIRHFTQLCDFDLRKIVTSKIFFLQAKLHMASILKYK